MYSNVEVEILVTRSLETSVRVYHCKILVDLGDFGQIPGPRGLVLHYSGGCCRSVFVSLLFTAHLINCAQLINYACK